MKNDMTDQLIVMAQMMADSDNMEAGIKAWLGRHMPLIIIVVVGIALTVFALVASQQWKQHIEFAVLQTTEKAYTNQIKSGLNRIQLTLNALTSHVEATPGNSLAQLSAYSQKLGESENQQDFRVAFRLEGDKISALLNMDGTTRLMADDAVQALFEPKLATLAAETFGDGFFLGAASNDGRNYIARAAILNTGVDSSVIILVGAFLPDLLSSNLVTDHYVEVILRDQLDQTERFQNSVVPREDKIKRYSHSYPGITADIGMEASTISLGNFTYFKWLLLSFALLFTAMLCAQFILAKRSIRKLSNLAVQRANDLTAINGELADEIINRVHFQAEVMKKTQEIQDANEKLEEAQTQLIQQEKMASLGQLAAGVAHEINNPVGFINSNLSMLKKYSERALQLIDLLDEIAAGSEDEVLQARIQARKKELRAQALQNNMKAVIEESQEGVERVKQIVQDLKDFSRLDEVEWQWSDLHCGIDSTLNIAWNELKYKAEVHKEYSEIPLVECVPSQINQVILNLLVNSAHAIEGTGNITIRTRVDGDMVAIEVADDGCGIPEEVVRKVFDPFFTTKEVGKGTGLGLSLSYGIVKKHKGDLTVESTPGVGTTFTITLPIQQEGSSNDAAANG